MQNSGKAMYMALLKAAVPSKNPLLVGQCIAHEIPKEAKIRVTTQEFDSYLTMYFAKYYDFIAHDTSGVCKDGDMVLIRAVPEKTKTHINHEVIKILYPLGDITDPLTGKKCVAGKYREITKFEKELYGRAEDGGRGFDYESAPDRGWQEGKKDITHRVGYLKFHVFPKGHPKHEDLAAT